MNNSHYEKTINSLKNASNLEINSNLIFYYILKATETKFCVFFISLAFYLPLFLILPFTINVVVMCLSIHVFSWFVQIQYMADEEKVKNEINPIIQALKDIKKSRKEVNQKK